MIIKYFGLCNVELFAYCLHLCGTFCPAWGFCGEAAGDQVPHRANVCHSGLAGSTSLIQEDSPKQRVVGVSSLLAAETQRIAATLGWSDDRREWWREGRWRLQHSRGAGLSQLGGCQSKKVNDSTMLAPPPPHVSSELPARPPKETSDPGNRSAERKRGMSECGFCLRCVDLEYLWLSTPGLAPSGELEIHCIHSTSPTITSLIESSDLLKRMGNMGLISLAACRGPRIWFVCAFRRRGRVQRLRRNGYLWTVRHTAIRGGGGEGWQKRRVYRMRESKRRVLVIRTDCQILLGIFKY